MYQTNKESAPCPAAHVVVMSQCESCGMCMFKDVVCASNQGVSNDVGRHTFMYKYSEDPTGELRAESQPRSLPAASMFAMGALSLAVVAGVVSRHRHGQIRNHQQALDMDEDAVAPMAEE